MRERLKTAPFPAERVMPVKEVSPREERDPEPRLMRGALVRVVESEEEVNDIDLRESVPVEVITISECVESKQLDTSIVKSWKDNVPAPISKAF